MKKNVRNMLKRLRNKTSVCLKCSDAGTELASGLWVTNARTPLAGRREGNFSSFVVVFCRIFSVVFVVAVFLLFLLSQYFLCPSNFIARYLFTCVACDEMYLCFCQRTLL